MRPEVARDMRKSTPDFLNVVWPALQKNCPELRGGQIRAVEGKETELSADLDMRAGIDAYQRWDRAMRGIACRVQWRDDYQTFTIRTSRPSGAETEYQKRLAVIKRRDEGFLYPYWTIQAYLDRPGGTLLSAAVAKTAELYLWIEQYENNVRRLPRRKATNGGESFLYVNWDLYRLSGNYLFVYSVSPLKERIDTLIELLSDAESEDEEVYREYLDPDMQRAESILQARDLNAWIEFLERDETLP